MSIIKWVILYPFIFVFSLTIFSQDKYNLNFDDFNPEEQLRPKCWLTWGDFATENIKGEKINESNSVGKIVSDKNKKFGCIRYNIPANYVGDSITLTGRIKYENVKKFVGLLMRIDGYGKMLAFKSMQNLKIKGTSDWKEFSIKTAYPTNASFIIVGGIIGNGGTAWFDDFRVTIDGKDIQILKETPIVTLKNIDANKFASALANSSSPINLIDQNNSYPGLDVLIEKIGAKKIVAIGESTHGTSEFYKLREIITKRLVKEKGFNLVVLENPYDDIELLNKKLYSSPLGSLMQKHLFSIYQTEEVKSFLQWYKDNRSNYDLEFKGCDDSYWVYYELLKSSLISVSDKKLSDLLKKLRVNVEKGATKNMKKEIEIKTKTFENLV